jgi:hypothetical protein
MRRGDVTGGTVSGGQVLGRESYRGTGDVMNKGERWSGG